MAGNPNPSSALIFFFVVTTIYFIVKYNVDNQKSVLMATISYVLSIIIGEFFINKNLTNEMCGEDQWGTAFSITLAPWLVIFGLFLIMLDIFPGWKTPFSNTIGYGVVLMAGVSGVVREIFKDPGKPSSGNVKIDQSIEYIYRDQSLLINEIGEGESAFNDFWTTMKSAMKANVFENSVLKEKLKGLVKLKYLTSEYIWYILIGALVTSISYNYLINIGCSHSAANMIKKSRTFSKSQDKAVINKEEEDKNKVVYTVTE